MATAVDLVAVGSAVVKDSREAGEAEDLAVAEDSGEAEDSAVVTGVMVAVTAVTAAAAAAAAVVAGEFSPRG